VTPARGLLAACATCTVLAAGTVPARAQEVGFGVAVSTARATRPDQRLSGVYVFNSLDVTAGPVRIWASVPLVTQRTTFDTLDPATGGPLTLRDTSSGFADPLIRLDLQLLDDVAGALQVGVSAAVKPGLADADKGLGTGATDVAFGASVFKGLGRTSLLADAQYWRYGDPEGLDYEDTLSYSLGIGRVMGSGRWSSLVSLSGFSRGIEGAPAPVQVNVAILALAGRRQSVTVAAGFGLNDSASDFTFGAGWRVILRQ
jgi:hypothetical protein